MSLLASTLLPPPLPLEWPSPSAVSFPASFLADPLVANAVDYVQKSLPSFILNIPPSTVDGSGTVIYQGNLNANCYWPRDQCTRATSDTYLLPDIVGCAAGSKSTYALAYDGGPVVNIVNGQHQSDTNVLRNLLEDWGLTASFFYTGKSAWQLPAEVNATFMGGHHIGSHGWSHRPFTTLTNAEIVAEIKYSEAAIYSAAKVVPRYFRPPLGDIDDRVRGILWALGYRVVLASTNPVRDLTDATGASISPIISGWGINKPGFIGLEQDIDSLPKLDVAVNMLNWLTQSSSKLKLQSITDCLSVTPYVAYSDTPSPTTHTAKRTKSTSALMPTASTPPVKSPAPTGSGVTQAIEHDHVYSDAQGSRHYYVETMAAGAAALVTYLMLAM